MVTVFWVAQPANKRMATSVEAILIELEFILPFYFLMIPVRRRHHSNNRTPP
jgi:hypothetical protein